MQNTTKSNENPDRLIQNFFIAGLSQEKFVGMDKDTKKLTPEILFSMYGEPDDLEKYVQFIFPHKLGIRKTAMPPTYHTFACLDENGSQCFYHCIKFQEELDEYQVKFDMDYEGPLMMQRTKKLEKQFMQVNSSTIDSIYQVSSNKKAGSDYGSDDDVVEKSVMHKVQEINKKLNLNISQAAKRKATVRKITREYSELHVPICQMLENKQTFEMLKQQQMIIQQNGLEQKSSSPKNKLIRAEVETKSNQTIGDGLKNIDKYGPDLLTNVETSNGGGTPQDYYRNAEKTAKFPRRGAHSKKFSRADVEQFYDDKRSDSRQSRISRFNNNVLDNPINKNVKNMINIPDYCMLRPRQNSKQADYATRISNIKFQASRADQTTSEIFYDAENHYTATSPGKHNRKATFNEVAANFAKQDTPVIKHLPQATPDFGSKLSQVLATQGVHVNPKASYEIKESSHFEYKETVSPTSLLGISKEDFKKHLQTRFYTTVALVFQSKVEFHDAFKHILLRIYESLKNPKEQGANILSKWVFKSEKDEKVIPDAHQGIVFADLLAHIAFLRTIPAPVFNSQTNILFMGIQLQLTENKFSEVPHKSVEPIKVLMECLDFQTIIKCVKALLLDKNMILFSLETSLLFNVIEGLKQLMFPFTFTYNQFLPANNTYKDANGKTLKDLFEDFEGAQPIVFALESNQNFSEKGIIEIDNYANWPDSVLLDVDASFFMESSVMEPKIPVFPNEIETMKALNRIKNRKFDNYDKVYPDNHYDNSFQQDSFRVQSIREVFFASFFKPFLIPAFETIDMSVQNPKNLNSYFNKQVYIENLIENLEDDPLSDPVKLQRYRDFAKVLVDCQSFAHFMDGYINNDISNFDLTNSILMERGSLQKRYKLSQFTLQPYNQKLIQKLKKLPKIDQDSYKAQFEQYLRSSDKSNNQQVCFYYRMPNFKQRIMLFEKIKFIIDKKVDKKEKIHFRGQNIKIENESQNPKVKEYLEFKKMNICYNKIVNLIRTAYKEMAKPENSKSVTASSVNPLVLNQDLEQHDDSPTHFLRLQSENQQAENSQSPNVSPRFQGGTPKQKEAPKQFSGLNLQPMLDQAYKEDQETDDIPETRSSVEIDFKTKNQLFQSANFGESLNTMTNEPDRQTQMMLIENVEIDQIQLLESYNENIKQAQESERSPTVGVIKQNQLLTMLSKYKNDSPELEMSQQEIAIATHALKKLESCPVVIQDDELSSNFTGYGVLPRKLQIKMNPSDEQIKKQMMIPKNDANSVRIFYGKKGFLNFLANLFVYMTEKDKQQLNFYFTIKDFIIHDCMMSADTDLSPFAFERDYASSKKQDFKQRHTQIRCSHKIDKLKNQFSKQNQNFYANGLQPRETEVQQPSANPMNFFQQVTQQIKLAPEWKKRSILVQPHEEFEEDDQEERWFGIERISSPNEVGERPSEISESQLESSNKMTYQEIMTFIKLINMFEIKKNKSEMIFWLLLQFPLVNLPLLEYYGNRSSEIENSPINVNVEVLEYLFPLKLFSCILDNMNNNTIIDLHSFFASQKQMNVITTTLNRLEYNYDCKISDQATCWVWPVSSFAGYSYVDQGMFSFRDILLMVMESKCQETVDALEAEITHIKDLNRILTDTILKLQDHQNFEQGLEEINKCKKLLDFKPLVPKREKNQAQYFETIDERNFGECDFERLELELEIKDLEVQFKEALKNTMHKTVNFGQPRTSVDEVKNSAENFWQKMFKRDHSKPNKEDFTHDLSFFNRTQISASKSPLESKSLKIGFQKTEVVNKNSPNSNSLMFNSSNKVSPMQEKWEKKRLNKRSDRKLYKQTSGMNNNHVSKYLMNPILLSVQFLTHVISFFANKKTGKDNQTLLNKGDVFNNISRNKDLRGERFNYIKPKLDKLIDKIANLMPVFQEPNETERRSLPFKVENKEFIEYSKQCFYLNIFNALVLKKIIEMCVVKPTQVFKLINSCSWLALMQNTSINIGGTVFTAWQLRQEVIRNVNKLPANNFHVDHNYVHPLIYYAFFVPHQGRLRLKDLCFTSVDDLIVKYPKVVHTKLKNHIRVLKDHTVIMLPGTLRNCFTSSDLKADCDQEFGRQMVVLRVLKFIYEQLYLRGNRSSTGQQETSELYKVITQLEPISLLCNNTSFGKSFVDLLSEKKEAPLYIIEFTDYSHALKKSKIFNGIGQKYNDELKKFNDDKKMKLTIQDQNILKFSLDINNSEASSKLDTLYAEFKDIQT